ncbi:MAG: OmpA family protein [Chitinophagales bacterium]|nr:OmpA family protein [Chitinophagales bacterium]
MTSSKVKSGTENFHLKRYATAIPILKEEITKAKTQEAKAEIAQMIAQAYDFQGKYADAEEWYKSVYDFSPNSETQFAYAQALMRSEKYTDAKKVLEIYLRENRQDRRIVEPMIATCDYVLKHGDEDKNYLNITAFKANSESDDFDANIIDGKIVFSSTRAGSSDTPTEWNNEDFSALWWTNSNGTTAEKYLEFANKYHIASLSMTADNKTAYFTQCGSNAIGNTDYCGIYRVQKQDFDWSEPEQIHIWGDTFNVGQSYITPDGQTLYFSSDAPYGYGGKDLYSLKIYKDGTYGEPINLGSRVNTTYDEMFPYTTSDENTLYFSSNKTDGFGGLDIYKATKVGRLFTNAEKLPYGINTGKDDFGLKLLTENNADTSIVINGFFTSNRNGNDNLYFVEAQKMPEKEIAPGMIILEGEVVENIYADSLNPNSTILGQQPIAYPDITLSKQSISSDEEGFFTTQLDSGFAYQLNVSKEDYLSVTKNFNTVNIQILAGDTIFIREKIVLSKIYRNVEIVLNNIYYDFDKADIREDAQPTLDTLAQLLLNNPKIEIELASHTDCRGNDDYNMKLSQRRAESAVEYLISKGVESNRLTAKGYGASLPVEQCACEKCTEDQHQRNRRTTFKVIN